jgi:hypothetical protein
MEHRAQKNGADAPRPTSTLHRPRHSVACPLPHEDELDSPKTTSFILRQNGPKIRTGSQIWDAAVYQMFRELRAYVQ